MHANGIVYILSNPYMPDVLKIGRTVYGRGQRRVEELFTTGVPAPFNVEYAAYVTSAAEVENRLHEALGVHRTHDKREHFEVDVQTARAALEPFAAGDATPEMLADRAGIAEDVLDLSQRPPVSGRRGNMDFFAMGLRPGDALLEKDSGRWAYVEDRRTIYFEGKHGQSLNGVYQAIHGRRRPGTWVTVGGTSVRWLFYNVQHGDENAPWKKTQAPERPN